MMIRDVSDLFYNRRNPAISFIEYKCMYMASTDDFFFDCHRQK